MQRYAEVVFPIPLRKSFHYRIPTHLESVLRPGVRIVASFGSRILTGYFMGEVAEPQVSQLKDILKVLDEAPVVDPALLRLARWISEYYFCSLGEALEAILPSGIRRRGFLRTRQIVELAISRPEARAEAERLRARHPKWSRVLEYLCDVEEEVTPAELARRLRLSDSPLKSLHDRGVLKLIRRHSEVDPYADLGSENAGPFPPTEEQQQALGKIGAALEARRFEVVLLYGVTSSGKTEVYLQSIASVVARGQQAIVLVPEISLTPQMVRRFRSRFERLAVLHSDLTEAQRAREWHRTRSGEAQVVIGARSAIFAPCRSLGLVVVDEEHEPSFKQQNAPRYHARDVAVMRGKIEDAVVVLGSATPALESYLNALEGKYTLARLRERIGGHPLPPVDVLDMAVERTAKRGPRVFSRTLETEIRETLARGEQVILFLNRRGFATLVSCRGCDFVLRCRRCEVAMTYHKQLSRALCHYCNEEAQVPELCPGCSSQALRYLGLGTEKVEQVIAQAFGSHQAARMDSDAMRSRGSYRRVLQGLWTGDTDILIGTQMVAKGLDFPNVTLVGIVSGDTCLYLKDFRSAERTFQLITQVAGRAGRGPKGGRVLLQTFNPGHYSIQFATRHDYEAFAAKELEFRRQFRYPPYTRLVRILVEGRKRERVEERAAEIGNACRQASLRRPADSAEVLGPAAAPIAQIKGKFRFHLLVKGKTPADCHGILQSVEAQLRSSRDSQVIVDVDPANIL